MVVDGRLRAALELLRLALAARPLGAAGVGGSDDESLVGMDSEGDDEEWPPSANELRGSDFVKVLRTVGGHWSTEFERLLATL